MLYRCLLLKTLLISLSMMMVERAKADIIVSDAFSYPDGPLYGQSGGAGGWLNSWTGFGIDVSGGVIVMDALGNPSSYGARVFTNPNSTPNLFFSVDISVGTLGLNDTFGVLGSIGVNTGQILFGKLPGSMDFRVGNGGNSGTGNDIVPNSNYRLIGAYAHGAAAPADLLLLWINATAADFFDPMTFAHSADLFRPDSAPSWSTAVTLWTSAHGISFDNLVISNDPLGVGLRASAIPEPGSSLIAWVLGGVLIARFRLGRLYRSFVVEEN